MEDFLTLCRENGMTLLKKETADGHFYLEFRK